MGIVDFAGRVAVVTGAGSGLGRQHALLLASRGAAVVVNDVADDGRAGQAVADEIGVAGGRAVASAHDIATADGAEAVVVQAVEELGGLDIVVNNAGILRSAEVDALDVDTWDAVTGVNLRGSFLVSRAAWAHFRERRYGRIVYTTSNSGLLGVPGSSAYSASKAGLWGLTRTLSLEGAELGIRVNAIAPLAFTPMARTSRTAPRAWRDGTGDAWSDRLAPERVSPVVGYLAHEDCVLNGEVLSVAGGRVARFFLGVTNGYVNASLDVEDVAVHIDEILDPGTYEIFAEAGEENRHLYRRLQKPH